MVVASLLAVLAAAPPTGFTSSVERIPLLRQGREAPTLVLDAMAGHIYLTHVRPKEPFKSVICPHLEQAADGAVLGCSSRRIWAGLFQDRLGPYLDLRVLRGIPRDGELAIGLTAWPVRALGIPDDCPGRLDATLGECALAEGKLEEAEAAYRKARGGPDSNLAYLRLGDLAAARGELEAAMHLYAFVPPVGPVGRLARARLCDLTGSCLSERDSMAMGETLGLPEIVKGELQLTTWRREALCGREAHILPDFTLALQSNPQLCASSMPLCQRILLAGLNSTDDSARAAALDGWLVESVRRGPFELELSIGAAHAAEDLGAPAFAATVLASSAGWVTRGDLDDHLLRIVQLYLAGRDPVRAAVILDYAEQRLGAKATRKADWRELRGELARAQHVDPLATAPRPPDPALPVLASEVALARDLAHAAYVRSQSLEGDAP
jgi:tetratricopeptide (TPR) repeat protein